MFKVPELDDLTYDQMVKRAISKIPSMTDEWTDFNAHDPGITVIETYAWLIDMLNYYMNATGDEHVKKFLKLLNVEPAKGKSAEGYIIPLGIAEKTMVPKFTALTAGDIPLEVAEDTQYSTNDFISCVYSSEDGPIDLTLFAGVDGDYAEIFSDGKPGAVYLGFEKPLCSGDRLLISIKQDEKRNDISEAFSLSNIKWEIRTAAGWSTVKVTDGTGGLLKSGFLELEFDGENVASKADSGDAYSDTAQAFYLKGSVDNNTFDTAPMLGRVFVNPIKVVQQRTVCKSGEIIPDLRIGKTDGCACQQLEFDYPDVRDFELILTDGENEKETWTMTDNLTNADYHDRVFKYDIDEKVIIFGDGINGAVPETGMTVYVSGLICSLLGEGNILPGQILAADDTLGGAEILSPMGAVGGRNPESVREMLERLEKTLLTQQRMACTEDYEKAAHDTPGLRIDMVHCMPGSVYGKLYHQSRGLNEVVLVVKPVSDRKTPVLPEIYRKCILENIEGLRLINTKLEVTSPRYVGITVRGTISLSQDNEENREAVREFIKARIDYECMKKPFGATISYGHLYTGIEALPIVRGLSELALERNSSAAEKNERGDILLHEDALSYLENIEFKFV